MNLSRPLTFRVAVVVLLTLLVLLAAADLRLRAGSGEDRVSGPTSQTATAGAFGALRERLAAITGPSCFPGAYPTRGPSAEYVAEDQGSQNLTAELATFRNGRHYCVTTDAPELPNGLRLTAYTVRLPGGTDDHNYDQTFTTADPDGSEELLHFPYRTTVWGPCATLTGRMTLTDRGGAEHVYRADLRVGKRCG